MNNCTQDYTEDAHFGYLALELCEYTLDEYITKLKEKNLLQVHSKKLVKELFQGLKTLHEAKVLHRDLKVLKLLFLFYIKLYFNCRCKIYA